MVVRWQWEETEKKKKRQQMESEMTQDGWPMIWQPFLRHLGPVSICAFAYSASAWARWRTCSSCLQTDDWNGERGAGAGAAGAPCFLPPLPCGTAPPRRWATATLLCGNTIVALHDESGHKKKSRVCRTKRIHKKHWQRHCGKLIHNYFYNQK